ncbi:GGDEF domain-containing protein [Salinisphaera hydrothermalis]|uniref:GGDEF domain-containing protein n=1 Tax=Salinisphaera hydrothermalis TaxID=563188 RepID=UPI00333E737B
MQEFDTRTAPLTINSGPEVGWLRRLVRRAGVWWGTLLFVAVGIVTSFAITGTAMAVAGLPDMMIGYVCALICSVTLVPLMAGSLLSLIRRLDEAESQLYHLARTDELTGLPNRRALIEAGLRCSGPRAVLMIDVDYFKRINDTYGHQIGDLVLYEVAGRLASQFARAGLLCRFGGEEFTVLLNDTDRQSAYDLAERARRNMAETSLQVADLPALHVTVSIGIAATSVDHSLATDKLIDAADREVYRAKHRGRNCVCLADTTTDQPGSDESPPYCSGHGSGAGPNTPVSGAA